MNSSRRSPEPAGTSLTVVPGYQRMTGAQRRALLALAEKGAFAGRTVWVRAPLGWPGTYRVSDGTRAWLVYVDGTVVCNLKP